MKTTLNKIVWLLFIAVTLASCSKENDDCDPEDENSPCYAGFTPGDKLLLTEEKTNGKTEMRFEYNEQNQVIVRYVHGTDGSVAREDFTYSGGEVSKVERSSENQLVMTEEYFYNNSDKPSTGLQKTNKGEILTNIIYTYSGNNVTETFYNKEGEQVGLNTSIFDDKGKNIVKVISTIQNIMLFTLEYGDYDASPCRYTNYPWAWRVGSVNNAQSYSLTSRGADGTVSTKNDRWKYTYNAAGYPTKAEVYDKASNTLIETREFIYKKAS